MQPFAHSIPLAFVCIASLFFIWTLVRPVSAAKTTPSVLRSPQMSSANYGMDWSTVGDISCGDTASTNYKMSETIGEMAASSNSSASTNYAVCSGFQCVLNILHVYLPLIFR